ncbi:helix-turn-helix domain-containing protein [Pedobacter sp.]|uniref:helix-turn-helix domain-containing protein n=1 Tax=Pedobacter sp. TaxID=1411316 RepID=UPI003BABDFEA
MESVNKSLGKILKDARELKGISLRELEIQSGISNAYLSQLENDKIKKPSANTLYRLSELFNMNFDDLMVSAGIVEKKKESTVQTGCFAFSSAMGDLTEEERDKIIEYLKFLRHQTKNDK